MCSVALAELLLLLDVDVLVSVDEDVVVVLLLDELVVVDVDVLCRVHRPQGRRGRGDNRSYRLNKRWLWHGCGSELPPARKRQDG